MEKNYYEILEVDKNASPEIIKKAYSTLAKQYHPDLQPLETKIISEEKFKLINEAYDVLSNEEKRKQYNLNITTCTVPLEKYNAVVLENQELKKIINELHRNYLRNHYTINESPHTNAHNNLQHTPNNYQHNPNHTYSENNSHYKFINKIKSLFAILLTILIMILLFQIPFVRNFIFKTIFSI